MKLDVRQDLEVRVAASCDALLGESPLWSSRDELLYWVDIKNPRLFRHDLASGETRITTLSEPVGGIGLRRGGGLIAAARSGLAFIDGSDHLAAPFARPEADRPGNRFNDAKCDRFGRFFAASMDDGESAATGNLYRIEPDLGVRRLEGGFVIGNGLGWSPDDRTFYFTDSAARRIFAYDYDPSTGRISNRRVFATVPEEAGFPDGLCVDAEGCVWSAHWDGACLTRYAPDGRPDVVVSLPVPRPTSCCFGGPQLDILFVTSARIGLSAADLARYPLSGSILALEPGVRGLAEVEFAGGPPSS
ncbi:MAG TPA: SMP-30/gluconolactonase/LRE family protein [Alphaproteobacteria bacterium]